MAATRRANNSFITGARKAAATKIANGQTKADAAKGIKTRQARPDYPEIVAKMVEAHKKNGTYLLIPFFFTFLSSNTTWSNLMGPSI